MSATKAKAAVYQDTLLAGTLARTDDGCVFTYDAAFVASAGRPLANTLPLSVPTVETRGVNLHPFFAGLLPEGHRLTALVRSVKTGEDDLLGLLFAVGAECVGDVRVVAMGRQAPVARPLIDPKALGAVSFRELLSASLEHVTTQPAVAGAQDKVSAAMVSFPVWGRQRTRAWLLKLSSSRLPGLVRNEHGVMRLARHCGLEVAHTELVADRNGEEGLLVLRFDRRWSRQQKRLVPQAQEDACQFLSRYPADKYRINCQQVAEGLTRWCSAPAPELLRFLQLVAFSYLVGNGDLHAKNVSIWSNEGVWRLAPAYDLVSTLPYGDRHMALQLEGRDDNLKRRDFIALGARHGLPREAVEAMLDELLRRFGAQAAAFDALGLDQRATADLQRTAHKRLKDLR